MNVADNAHAPAPALNYHPKGEQQNCPIDQTRDQRVRSEYKYKCHSEYSHSHAHPFVFTFAFVSWMRNCSLQKSNNTTEKPFVTRKTKMKTFMKNAQLFFSLLFSFIVVVVVAVQWARTMSWGRIQAQSELVCLILYTFSKPFFNCINSFQLVEEDEE